MNLKKRNSNNARIWILRPQRCISSLSFFATLALFILYFVFLILHFLFLILLFLHLLPFFLLHWISQSVQRKSKFVVLHILQLLLFYESHFVACCNVYYGRRRLLQFQCNRFCFKKRNVFSSQLHCRELPSSAACQFALGSALPPSLSLFLMFVFPILYIVLPYWKTVW